MVQFGFRFLCLVSSYKIVIKSYSKDRFRCWQPCRDLPYRFFYKENGKRRHKWTLLSSSYYSLIVGIYFYSKCLPFHPHPVYKCHSPSSYLPFYSIHPKWQLCKFRMKEVITQCFRKQFIPNLIIFLLPTDVLAYRQTNPTTNDGNLFHFSINVSCSSRI